MINTNFKSLTKAEQTVAIRILEDPKQVFNKSITEFAELCGVGDTSVFRFCIALGLEGYQEFKIMLAQSLDNTSDSYPQSEEIGTEDSIECISKKIYQDGVSAFSETYKLLNFDEVEYAVDLILKAKKVLFIGSGSSATIANEARNRFARINLAADFIYDTHMQVIAASLMKKDDVVIAFSYSGSTKDVIDVLSTAKKSSANIICITRFAKSQITEYADVTLLSGSRENPLQGGALSTKIAQLYLLEILYSEYFKKHSDISARNKKITSEAVSCKQL